MAKAKETKKATKTNVHEVVVKIEGKEWTEAIDKAFAKKQKTVKVDGFRPGKVPRDIFEKRFGKELSSVVIRANGSLTIGNREFEDGEPDGVYGGEWQRSRGDTYQSHCL